MNRCTVLGTGVSLKQSWGPQVWAEVGQRPLLVYIMKTTGIYFKGTLKWNYRIYKRSVLINK